MFFPDETWRTFGLHNNQNKSEQIWNGAHPALDLIGFSNPFFQLHKFLLKLSKPMLFVQKIITMFWTAVSISVRRQIRVGLNQEDFAEVWEEIWLW